MNLAIWGSALVAGLLGGTHCVGMCGGFAAAASSRGTAGGVAWHGGRALAYAMLGALGGSLGGALARVGPIANVVMAMLLVWFALRLAGVLEQGLWSAHRAADASSFPGVSAFSAALVRVNARLARTEGVAARVAFGAATALLPCGLLWSALAMAGAAGSPFVGAGAMLAFWAGTVPALTLVAHALRKLATARPWMRRVVALGVLVAGLTALATRN